VLAHVLVLTAAGFVVGLAGDDDMRDRIHIQGGISQRAFPGLPAPPPPEVDQPCQRAVLRDVDTIERFVPAICTTDILGGPHVK